MKDFHCISGLPRSGSTLLAALLSQHPDVHAGMSSPVLDMLETLLVTMSGRSEYSVFVDDERREKILRGVAHSYYEDVEKPCIVDTNRAWNSQLALLGRIFPGAKVVACVRQVPWILDSIERLVRKNCLQPSLIFNYQTGGNVYSRVEGLAGANGFVGFSYNSLKEAYFSPEARGRLLLLRYERFTADPVRAMAVVSKFLGLSEFQYNLKKISLDCCGFDEKIGMPGLHFVSGPVRPWCERESILPPDLFQRFTGDAFWEDKNFLPAIGIF